MTTSKPAGKVRHATSAPPDDLPTVGGTYIRESARDKKPAKGKRVDEPLPDAGTTNTPPQE